MSIAYLLQHISERWGLVTGIGQFLLRQFTCAFNFPTFIDAFISNSQNEYGDDASYTKSKFKPMSQIIVGGVLRTVEITCHGSGKITSLLELDHLVSFCFLAQQESCRSEKEREGLPYPDVDSHPRCSLVTSSEVVTNPRDIARKTGIDSHHGDEDSGVHHTRDASSRRRKNNDEANGD